MPGFGGEGSGRSGPLQARRKRAYVCAALLACAGLLGCSDPVSKPVDLFHDLEGGEIAAERPPPPGAGQPYPHVGTVPEKPVMPDKSFRTALEQELASERDEKEVLAADLPVEKVPPPPVAVPPPPAAPGAGPVVPAPADAVPAADAAANATLSAADAPPPPPAARAAPPAPPPLPSDAALQIAGEPVDMKGLPLVPDGPPAPAALEGVAAAPAPTPRVLPGYLPKPAGTQIYFDQGSDTVSPSQAQSIKEVASRRKNRAVLVTGLGEADSDSPVGQESAIGLAVRRARAVAHVLADMHVPQSALRIAAQPFGRGVVVSLSP